MNRYVHRFYLYQRVQWLTQRLLGTLKPLVAQAGPWTDLNYDFITSLPVSNSFFFFFGIPMVMAPLTKMACFVPFSKRWWQSSNWQIWCWDKFGRSKASQRAIFSQTKELSLYHRSPRNSTSNLISNHTLQQSITPGLTDHLELLRSWLSSMYVSFTQYH